MTHQLCLFYIQIITNILRLNWPVILFGFDTKGVLFRGKQLINSSGQK
jgi:hypothetical protein